VAFFETISSVLDSIQFNSTQFNSIDETNEREMEKWGIGNSNSNSLQDLRIGKNEDDGGSANGHG